MTTRIAAVFSFIALADILCGQTPVPGSGEPREEDHPSNGVVELTVKPIADLNLLGNPAPQEVYPWTGLIEIGILNVSSGMVRLDEGGEWDEYTFTVLDSSGKSVPLTERGKKESDRAAHPDPHRILLSASVIELAPLREFKDKVDLSEYYQVRPGQPYKIGIKRTKGLPTVDEGGKPLKRVEVSRTVEVPDYGILR